jgi:hypothetical protein
MSRLWWFFLLYCHLESLLSATPLSKFDNGSMVTQTKSEIESANEIFARRARKLLLSLPASGQPADPVYVASFVRNLESVGYAASESLIAACSKLSINDLTALNNDALKSLRKARGALHPFKPMYPNFPSQVMNMSDARLYWNALWHYLTNGRFLPESEKEPRAPLNEDSKLQVLNLGTQEEFDKTFTQLCSSNTSLSDQDIDDLSWFVVRYGDDIERLLPDKIPNREVRAIVCARLIELTSETKKRVPTLCDTATDILRLSVALSGGDVSLAEPVRFRQFKRSERRLLTGILEVQNNLVEDMLRWKGRWIRLGERLHPGEYRNTYPKAAQAFDILRNNLPAETFNSRLESALARKDTVEIMSMLKSRPGDFARRLDHLLRLNGAITDVILAAFSDVAERVSTPVLLQVMHHFISRNCHQDLRIFLPKGQVAKAQAIVNNLPKLEPAVCDSAAAICASALAKRFEKLPPLGKCFVDPELKNFLVPFSQRSASKSLRTAARGSRLMLPESDTLRFFVWWKNGRDRTDLDLSAVMFDKNFCYVSAVTFYNLKNFGGHHSGDIVDAPQGASEFIDVSRERCLQQGVRYIVMTINSYTAQRYCDLPECFAGWMGRVKPNSGEIYEPKTVQDKLDISSNTKIAIPAIFDLEGGHVIWADIALTKWPFWYNTVAANLWGIQLTLRSMVELSKPCLYDLLKLHAESRGGLVLSEQDADTVLSVANGTPLDLAKIASEFLRT